MYRWAWRGLARRARTTACASWRAAGGPRLPRIQGHARREGLSAGRGHEHAGAALVWAGRAGGGAGMQAARRAPPAAAWPPHARVRTPACPHTQARADAPLTPARVPTHAPAARRALRRRHAHAPARARPPAHMYAHVHICHCAASPLTYTPMHAPPSPPAHLYLYPSIRKQIHPHQGVRARACTRASVRAPVCPPTPFPRPALPHTPCTLVCA